MGTSAASEVVLREDVDGFVAVLRLNRPERLNAWGADMGEALEAHFTDMGRDTNIRAVVLTGSGDHAFSSGADVGNAATHRVTSIGEHLAELRMTGHPAFEAVLNFTKPLICAVNGYAIGAGFLIALCCDIILVSEKAVFSLPQAQLGILPAYAGLVRLASWVGRGRAMNIGLTGRMVRAQEANEIGLASSIHAPDRLEAAALELARELASYPPLAMKLTKESLNLGLEVGGSTRAAGIADLYRFLVLEQTDDSVEAHAAFRDKRPGKYRFR
jgi:enoyl-CoA hydratase/carnithine racemase